MIDLEELKTTEPRNWPDVFIIKCIHCGPQLITKMLYPNTWYRFLAAYRGSLTCPTICPRCSEEVDIKTMKLI